MIKDIFVPSRIGSYYIFNKRVLGFELNATSVQASLFYFSGNKVELENSMSIALQDQNQASIINAIKKIATTIGQYDLVVTSLTSSAVIFKELVLPFIGREKIKMIVGYEIEPLLPFTLDEAVIDFIITQENKEKSQTTILVAAARQIDIDNHTAYFEKAGIALDHVTLDMFALYDFYRHGMYVAQAATSLLLVDFSIDAIRILYIEAGILKSIRLVPYGLATMMSKADDGISSVVQHRILDGLLDNNVQDEQDRMNPDIAQKISIDFCKQVTLSLSFFQKQIKNFIMPSKVICLGAGTGLPGFLEQSLIHCQIPLEFLDIKKILLKNNVIIHKKVKIDAQHCASAIIALSAVHYGDVNFLSKKQDVANNSLLNKQLLVIALISCSAIAGVYFYSQYQLRIWNTAYDKSKKEMTNTLKDQMDIDTKGTKRVGDLVSAAQNKLEQSKKVCFSFSEKNHSFLRYLQEISSGIDRVSIGLDLRKLSLHDKEVVLQGSVKGWNELDTFIKELIELKGFILQGKRPDVPNDFTVTLQAQENHDEK